MKLTSAGIVDGYILDKYGKHGSENIKGMPSLSLPLNWGDFPSHTKSFAIVMIDHDSIPVCGFTWIHWVALVPWEIDELEENASMTNPHLVQGVNSWVSSMGGLSRKEAAHFGGPAPPDKEHTYIFKVYALDRKIDLTEGFYFNELYKEMQGHILEEVTLEGKYRA